MIQSKLRIGLISPFKKIYNDVSLERFATGGSEITNFIASYLGDSHYKSYVVDSEDGPRTSAPQITDLLFVVSTPMRNHFLNIESTSTKYRDILHWMAFTKKIVWVRSDPTPTFRFFKLEEFIRCHRFKPNHKSVVKYASSKSFRNPVNLLIIPDVYVDSEKEKLRQVLKIQPHHEMEFINLTGVSWLEWNHKRIVQPYSTKRNLVYIGNNRSKRLNALWKYHKRLDMQVYGNWKSQGKVAEIFGSAAIYNGKLKHNQIRSVYNNLTTSVITVDSHVEGLSYYPTRMWEILRYGGSFLIAVEADFCNSKGIGILNRWVVESVDDVKRQMQYDYWREQRRVLETITPSKSELYTALDNLIEKYT